jgi:hypothetical protein
MWLAEIVVLLVIAALLYAALTPFRRAIERRFMAHRRPSTPAAVIRMERARDGIFTTPEAAADENPGARTRGTAAGASSAEKEEDEHGSE